MAYRSAFNLITCALLALLLLPSPRLTARHLEAPERLRSTFPLQTSNTVYLPIAMDNYASEAPIFGIEIIRGKVTATLARRAGALGNPWVRYNGFRWSEIEPTPGRRDWSNLNQVEAELRALAAQGVTLNVVVSSTPAWARQRPNTPCGPIASSALDAFADFMRELVARYSGPPYHVRYWELWNEPDVAPELVDAASPFGCWGDARDPYYGGGYYAEMLKRVYPAIKQANPNAQVVLGGLLLDCDPTRPPAGKDCQAARFFEGILRNGGGSAFDLLAYHAYVYWSPTARDWDQDHPAWRQRGGALLGKLDFLRATMRQYGITKPVLMNEGSILCQPANTACPGAQFGDDQANYAVRLYTRAWAHGLQGAVWYTLDGPGWLHGGLLDGTEAPRPAYKTLTFMSSLLKDAIYTGPLHSGTMEGYAFRKGTTTYQIRWTNAETSVTLALPANTHAIYDKFGQPVIPGETGVSVGFDPLFIEIRS